MGSRQYDPTTAPLGVCGWCNQEFRLKSPTQLGAINSGRLVFCCKSCRSAMHRSIEKVRLRYTLGPCPTCGKMFRSARAEKTFCSMKCYLSHDGTADRLRRYNKAREKPPKACPQCGKVFSNRSTKFCSRTCYRQYFADRFDRFVANPEQLALPQCYDEFLTQAELPCLIDGCDWKGKRLAAHANFVHGITKDELKELAGFNRTTGLVPPAEHEAMSACAKERVEKNGLSFVPLGGPSSVTTAGYKPRLEGKEHSAKARAVRLADGTMQTDIPCRGCGVDVKQPPMGRKLYCTTACRASHYYHQRRAELNCGYCGKSFWASYGQVLQARKGGNVACSNHCKGKMNMRARIAQS